MKEEARPHVLFGHSVVRVEATHSPINLLLEGFLVALQQFGCFFVQRIVGVWFLEKERSCSFFLQCNFLSNVSSSNRKLYMCK